MTEDEDNENINVRAVLKLVTDEGNEVLLENQAQFKQCDKDLKREEEEDAQPFVIKRERRSENKDNEEEDRKPNIFF